MSDIPEEDKHLFRQAMKTVKPLARQKTIDEPKNKLSPIVKRQQPVSQSLITHPVLYLSDSYHEDVLADTILSYLSPGFPTKRFRELKTGKIAWQARLDLHGLRSEIAKETLLQFIVKQHEQMHRCLLIIHGKGNYSNQPPVLKNLVNHWLKQIPQINAFHSALARDGGAGAVYVLLTKKKPGI